MPPKWGQVREFCRVQGYRETRGNHIRYAKALPDRTLSGTMVSHGVDSEEVPHFLWTLVWRHQLRLAREDEFWKGLRGEAVDYIGVALPEVAEPMPAYLVRFLINVLHRSESEVRAIATPMAQQLWDEFHSREMREP